MLHCCCCVMSGYSVDVCARVCKTLIECVFDRDEGLRCINALCLFQKSSAGTTSPDVFQLHVFLKAAPELNSSCQSPTFFSTNSFASKYNIPNGDHF